MKSLVLLALVINAVISADYMCDNALAKKVGDALNSGKAPVAPGDDVKVCLLEWKTNKTCCDAGKLQKFL